MRYAAALVRCSRPSQYGTHKKSPACAGLDLASFKKDQVDISTRMFLIQLRP
jgi:hypothetical protein